MSKYSLDFIADYLLHRKNPVQLVKHFDEVPESKIVYPLIGQFKYDGVYCLLIKCGAELGIFSRVGKPFYFENLKQFMDGQLVNLDDGVYIGELCANEITLEVLSGYVSPNRKKTWDAVGTHNVGELGYIAFHDYITLDELLDGYSSTRYGNRHTNLEHRLNKVGLSDYLIKQVAIFSREEADTYTDDLIKRGHEGAVFKNPSADWIAGHKGWHSMKIVRGVHLDLLCTGVVYGKGKRVGQIAALEFSYKGNTFKADLGKGWTDERRTALTNDYESGDLLNCTYPVGKIWELKALDISSTGKALRLPKVVRIREDKDTPDN